MRILVPVDDSSHSRHAIEFLVHRETLLGSNPEIGLVNVQYSVPEKLIKLFSLSSVKAYCLDEGRKVFERLNAETSAAKLHATEKVLYGEPAKAIAEEVESTMPDLIIMGQRGLNPLKSLVFGSVSNAVLASTRTPVLLLRDRTPPVTDNLRVGICVDGSEYGEAAAEFVLKHLEMFGKDACFEVLHAAERPTAPIAPNPISVMTPTISAEEIEAEQRQAFEKAIAPVISKFQNAGVKIDAKLVFGEPAEVLADYANEHLDLVVMGSHGYGNFTAAVMGSTAMHLAARSEKPLLVIRRPED